MDQWNQGEIQSDVDENIYGDYRVRIVSRIKVNNSYFLRSITVYKYGKIFEGEWSDWSKFERNRVIYKSGLLEEYSIHRYSGFGIRKVVYPDGQQFTNEVYGWMKFGRELNNRWWNAIAEETYAIQNKSIPLLLGKNERKEHRFVSEDGSFNTIKLRKNDNEKSFSSNSFNSITARYSDSLRFQEINS